MRQPRRPNLATIVGSGLAVVAAGSLLAFSSLAEQAGLQGLSAGGIQPAVPSRGANTRAIKLPAPTTAAPGEPADPIEEIVRDAIARAAPPPLPAPDPRVTPGAPAKDRPERPEKKDKPRRKDDAPNVVAFTPKETAAEPVEETGGPPYGNAYGHHKKPGKPHPAKPSKKKSKGSDAGEASAVYARKHADKDKGKGEAKAPKWKPAKPAKAKKIDEHMSGGKGKGHAKHDHDNGKGRGKGKGHSKHGH